MPTPYSLTVVEPVDQAVNVTRSIPHGGSDGQTYQHSSRNALVCERAPCSRKSSRRFCRCPHSLFSLSCPLLGRGSPCRCDSVGLVSLSTPLPAGVTVGGADDADSPAMALLAATSFGSFRAPESTDMRRSMMPADGAVAVCDGAEIVGMSMYLDRRLTVPGGAVLRAAGTTWVAVSPTHRRRGLLRAMLDELHRRITCTSTQLPRCWPVKAASTAASGMGPPRSSNGYACSVGGRSFIQRFPTQAASKSSVRPNIPASWLPSMNDGAGVHRADCTPRRQWDEIS
jgi:GNAT acetyltransferase-like protein